ncbi:DpnD/PcfM family protein [Paraprevotella xylaniphila]|uniref:DpnD/PcfM family protein n=1 Tax=Paraprevotella xylaniphila TaxID=454155 RepID=UPI001032C2E6|nr:DpnD/PcfM family protein [Paraprevotella xylaniphila]
MMKYKFKIIEALSKVIEVEAEDYDVALEKVEEMIDCEEVVLTADDFEGREIYPYEDENQ